MAYFQRDIGTLKIKYRPLEIPDTNINFNKSLHFGSEIFVVVIDLLTTNFDAKTCDHLNKIFCSCPRKTEVYIMLPKNDEKA